MDGISSLILAAVLGGAPLPWPVADRPCSDRFPAARLEVEWQPLALDAAPGGLAVVETMMQESMYLSPSGWLGIAVHDDLALLLDVRIDRVPMTPDPARPDPRDAVTARLGVEIRPSIAIPL